MALKPITPDGVSASSFSVKYPFVRCEYTEPCEDGEIKFASWRPGTDWEQVSNDDFDCVADGVGTAEYIIIGRFKPGKYPERVFFTRQWVSPDGKRFGKSRLHICTAEKFRRLIKGYAYPYGMRASSIPEAAQ